MSTGAPETDPTRPWPLEQPLSGREARVSRSLQKLKPALAELFHSLLAFGAYQGRIGFASLAAHAGRELTQGVLKELVGYAQPTTQEREAAEATGEGAETHRQVMGRAFGLSADHPTIDHWHSAHGDFVSAAHYAGTESNADRARRAIPGLTSILDALLAPYFDVESDLSDVISKPIPDENDFAVVMAAIGKRQLKWHTYRGLTGPSWLAGLEARGCFGDPPMARRFDENRWAPDVWVEGEYLLRIAAANPEGVARILRDIPKTNDNPFVWDILAKAMGTLPIDTAASFTKLLIHGINAMPVLIWHEPLVQVVERFARDGQTAKALKVAKALMQLKAHERPDSPNLGFGLSEPPRFDRLDRYDVQDTVTRIVAAFKFEDQRSVFEWLLGALKAALTLTRRPPAPKGRASRRQSPDREHSYWCTRIDGSDHNDDSRVVLVRALAATAERIAGQSESDAVWVLKQLEGESIHIVKRLRAFVLARSAPFAAAEVDAWLGKARVDALRGREAGDVLRRRFTDASAKAQAAFVRAVIKGPPLGTLRAWVARTKEMGQKSTIKEQRLEWQLRVLRRFDDKLPLALNALASELGHTPAKRRAEIESLDEEGFHSHGGVSWVGEKSPLTDDELAAKHDLEIARSLLEWRPLASDPDAPSRRGLNEAVSGLVARDPDRGFAIGAHLVEMAEAAEGIGAVATGLRNAVRDGSAVDPLSAIRWAAKASVVLEAQRRSAGSAKEPQSFALTEAARSCIDVIDEVTARNQDVLRNDEVWSAVDRLLGLDLIWVANDDENASGMDALLTRALNRLDGVITRLVIEAGRRHFLFGVSPAAGADRADERTAAAAASAKLMPRLEAIVTRAGKRSHVMSMIGQNLALLHFLDNPWLQRNLTRLQETPSETPGVSALWGSFLVAGRFTNTGFRDLREEYSRAVDAIGDMKREGHWSIPQHLAEHLMAAAVWGLDDLSASTSLVRKAWKSLHEEDIGHAYWTVFRGWSDWKQGPDAEVRDRLTRFWSWRLDELEEDSPRTARSVTEANGLSWWTITPHVDADVIISLGTRTFRLADAENHAGMQLWEELAGLPDNKADTLAPLAQAIIDAEFRGRYPRVFASQVGPVLKRIAEHGSAATRESILHLVNQLGEKGYTEFRGYLPLSK